MPNSEAQGRHPGRRAFLGGLAAMALGGRTGLAAPPPLTVYVGSFSTWGSPRGRGLETAAIDADTGRLSAAEPVAGVPDASFLAISADGRRLYAVNELKPEGRLTALDIGGDPRRPSILNIQPAGGAGPTHLSLHPGGRHLFTASYTDGTVAVHALLPDGRIGGVTDIARHEGARPPHAHQILPDPSGRWVIAVDVGADSVYAYAFDPAVGRLRLNQRLRLPDGAGPRHLTFHPNGRFAYILGELRPEITVAGWDAEAGRFTPGQVVATLDPPASGRNLPAEIQVSPDGRFVYASNRGPDSISLFRTGPSGEQLAFVGATPTGGAGPRHFTLDPTGRRLYVANQKSGAVTWLPRDAETGRLGPAASSATVNGVAMILFR
jgi:6-phosphogluconolactonase